MSSRLQSNACQFTERSLAETFSALLRLGQGRRWPSWFLWVVCCLLSALMALYVCVVLALVEHSLWLCSFLLSSCIWVMRACFSLANRIKAEFEWIMILPENCAVFVNTSTQNCVIWPFSRKGQRGDRQRKRGRGPVSYWKCRILEKHDQKVVLICC